MTAKPLVATRLPTQKEYDIYPFILRMIMCDMQCFWDLDCARSWRRHQPDDFRFDSLIQQPKIHLTVGWHSSLAECLHDAALNLVHFALQYNAPKSAMMVKNWLSVKATEPGQQKRMFELERHSWWSFMFSELANPTSYQDFRNWVFELTSNVRRGLTVGVADIVHIHQEALKTNTVNAVRNFDLFCNAAMERMITRDFRFVN